MVWTIVTAVATMVSMLAYIVTALYIRAELKALDKDRYLSVTSELFNIWQNAEFMQAQMWIMYKMPENTWDDFVKVHRGDYGEIAFHRVGSYYDRVGKLIELKLINEKEILPTVGGYAIAVWHRMQDLIHEARKIENSVMFESFEKMLPSCYECYVPSLGEAPVVEPFRIEQKVHKITVKELKKKLDSGEPITLLDVRQPSHIELDPRKLPGEIYIPPSDITDRYSELPPEREIDVFCA